MFSWPKVIPGSASVRPSYMCRSEPQIAVEVIRTITSVGAWMAGSSTSSTATSYGPLYTTAFMNPSLLRYRGHSGADFFDNPHVFVAKGDTRLGISTALIHVQVRTADSS